MVETNIHIKLSQNPPPKQLAKLPTKQSIFINIILQEQLKNRTEMPRVPKNNKGKSIKEEKISRLQDWQKMDVLDIKVVIKRQ